MDKLDQICSTALKMFIADGYSQTPLSRITSAVGLTKAGLYKTFAAFAALGMCSWTFYGFDYGRKGSAEELADTYAEIFLKGLVHK